MWRFYIQKPNATIDEMSPSSRLAWFACYRVYTRLLPNDQETVTEYYSIPWENRTADPVSTAAKILNRTEQDVRRVIDNAVRMAAIERGLADG